MEIRSKTLGIIVAVVIFGGIMGAAVLGLWNTKSGRTLAVNQLDGSVGGAGWGNAGTAISLPADIRGNHRFGDISEMFDIPLDVLVRAFALPADVDPATFRTQDFESIYPDFGGELEIGNGSLKWFVALYTGLPYEFEDEEEATYLLRPAVDILMSHADLTAEQIAYLNAHIIEIENIEFNSLQNELQTGDEEIVRQQDEMVVAGLTTFADLLDWGVPAEKIEAIIGGEIPNRLTLVKDYCTEKGLSFGHIKAELQVEVDELE